MAKLHENCPFQESKRQKQKQKAQKEKQSASPL
jgi:hypothetical protein